VTTGYLFSNLVCLMSALLFNVVFFPILVFFSLMTELPVLASSFCCYVLFYCVFLSVEMKIEAVTSVTCHTRINMWFGCM